VRHCLSNVFDLDKRLVGRSIPFKIPKVWDQLTDEILVMR